MSTHRPPSRVTLACVLALILLTIFICREAMLWQQVYFQRDVQLMGMTQMAAFSRAIHEGAWPVWNPYIGYGQPLWADANTQVLYPPTWLLLVLSPWRYYTLFVVAHLAFAACGLFLLARRYGLSTTGALLSAATFLLSGPLLSTIDIWNQLSGAAWMPWIVLAFEKTYATRDARSLLLSGIAWCAPILAGAPEAALMAAAIVLVRAIALARRDGRRPASARIAYCAWSLLIGVGLSAALWLPALAAARQSGRMSLPSAAVWQWSVAPQALLTAWLPVPLDQLDMADGLRRKVHDGPMPLMPSLYLGLGNVFLVTLGLVSQRLRMQRGLALLMGIGLLIALGRHTPLHWMLSLFPGAQTLRYPVKAMLLVALLWALLVGFGWEAARQRCAQNASQVALLALMPWALIGSLAYFAWPTTSILSAVFAATTPVRYRLAIFSALFVLVFVLTRSRFRPDWIAPALGALSLLDLAIVHDRLNPTAPEALYRARAPLIDPLSKEPKTRVFAYDYFVPGKSERHLNRAAPYRLARTPRDWPYRAAQAWAMRTYLFPPSPGAHGLRGSLDRDVPAIGSRTIAQLTETLYLLEDTPAFLHILRLGGVTHVVALHSKGLEGLVPFAQDQGLFPEPITAYRVPATRPRCFAVGADMHPLTGAPLTEILCPERDLLRSA
ncbi:MAG: hypothetical protein MUF51_05395, partial [Vicinamibacteria bacterium]|nr:hypothetical protein [Vicinamibacteria bacterium]